MRPPNVLVLITDQQRAPRHWPREGAWLRELMPADAELARTGVSFRQAFCNSCMCTPSRATLFTGRYPAEHGCTLTLTTDGARPRLGSLPGLLTGSKRALAESGVPRAHAIRAFGRMVGAAAGVTGSSPEDVLDPATPNLARMLEGAGYHVAYKGKWHLSQPLGPDWAAADAELIAERYGFRDWEAPDAGENIEPERFGGGSAGRSEQGWDEDYTRQALSFLQGEELPEPFALVVSLVNPHDVLAYPSSYERGGYDRAEFSDLGLGLPATFEENLSGKPGVHALMRQGQTAFLGPLRGERECLDYVNFYAHLHRLVDAKIGRIVAALGSPEDPLSLRSRTIVVRTSDHGEMGLAHGGLRQKMFNAYEETVNVPLVVSNPALFGEPVETDALASLVDLMPTLATLCGAQASEPRGTDLAPVLAHASRPVAEMVERVPVALDPITHHPHPSPAAQDSVLFTFDDHKAGSSLDDVAAPPNRIRCLREQARKYAVYLDPGARAAPQFELYDLERDPEERNNLVDRDSGAVHSAQLEEEARELHRRLVERAAAASQLDDIPPRPAAG